MHSNTLPQTWVKNVYSLCVEGVVICVRSYTGWVQNLVTIHTVRVQPTIRTQLITTFPLSLYTGENSYITDATTDLSPLSTVPTIKKKKENKKGN